MIGFGHARHSAVTIVDHRIGLLNIIIMFIWDGKYLLTRLPERQPGGGAEKAPQAIERAHCGRGNGALQRGVK